ITPTRLATSLAWALTCGCGGGAPETATPTTASNPPGWTVKVEPLEIPAGASSMAPQLTSSSRGVLVSWLEQADPEFVLKFAERSGAAWSAAQKVASSKDWFVSA